MLVMTTAWLVLCADIRRRWPALLGLVLLLGLIGGVVLTAAAGARRTDTAYPRLLRWANATQVDIIPEGTGFTGYYAALARLPHIAARRGRDPAPAGCVAGRVHQRGQRARQALRGHQGTPGH
jgi:hypothetical protein